MSVEKATPIGERVVSIEGGGSEILAILLSNFIPSERAVEVTHALRERFGSVSKAMRRQAEELRRIPGLCDTAAFAIGLVHRLYVETLREDLWREDLTFRSGAAVRYCREAFHAEDRDVTMIFYLREERLVHEGPVTIGAVGANHVYTREVMKTALFREATRALIVFGRSYGCPGLNQRETAILEALRFSAEPFGIEIEADLVLTHQ